MFDDLRAQLIQIIDKHKVANKWLTVEINVSIYDSTRCPDRSDLHNLLTTWKKLKKNDGYLELNFPEMIILKALKCE